MSYYYLTIKKDLINIFSKHEEKFQQLGHYIIIRSFRGIPINCDDDYSLINTIYEVCKNKKKKELQVIIQGHLITLSQKMFFTLYLLLTLPKISEDYYCEYTFRPNRVIDNNSTKKQRDLDKSIDDLKRILKGHNITDLDKIAKGIRKSESEYKEYKTSYKIALDNDENLDFLKEYLERAKKQS